MVRDHKIRLTRKFSPSPTTRQLRNSAITRLAGVVQRTTWSSRITVLHQANTFLRQRSRPIISLETGPPEDPTGLLLYLETVQHPSTRLNYAKILKQWYVIHQSTPPALLLQYIKAAGREAQLSSPKQAWGITRKELMELADAQEPWLRLGLFLAWKTHSRWDEIAKLSARSFLRVEETEIVIAFATPSRTATTVTAGIKTAHHKRHQLQFYVAVRDKDQEVMRWAHNLIATIPPQRRSVRLFRQTTQQIDALLATIPLRPQLIAQMELEAQDPHAPPRHNKYTAHSIKKGAMDETCNHCAMGLLPPTALAIAGKHKSQMCAVPENSVRYVQENPNLALLNESAAVTILV